MSEKSEFDDTLILGLFATMELQDEAIHSPLHLLSPDQAAPLPDRIWLPLGEESYLVQQVNPKREGADGQNVIIHVVGVADADDLAPNVLLLG